MSLRAYHLAALAALPGVALVACGGGETQSTTSTPTTTATGGAGGAGGATASTSTTVTTGGATTSTTTTTSSAGGGGTGGAPAGIISVSPDSMMEAETHLAVAPNDVTVVAWIAQQADGGSTNGYVFSTDRGATWGPVQQLASPNGEVASDPVLAFDSQNNFYMTWIGFKFASNGNPYDMHVYVAKAPAGSTTFGAPIEVTQGSANDEYDKPWIAVTGQDTVIITYAKTSTGGIYAARSTDQAQTWDNVLIVEDGGFRNLLYPCLPPGGSRIYVTYHAGGGIGLRWSDDDGLTWPQATAVAASGEQPAFDDPTCVAAGNDVWVSYGLSKDTFSGSFSSRLTSIRIAHSTDGGATFASHGNAHDLTTYKLYQHPHLTREAGGRLHLVYYAGNKEADAAGSLLRAWSDDGGQTWAPAVEVRKPINFTADRASVAWLGDYFGVAWSQNELFASFVDNTGDYAHVAFAKAATP